MCRRGQTLNAPRKLLAPVAGDPARRFDMGKALVAPARQRVGRVDFAVEDDDARALGHEGRLAVVGGPGRDAAVLEAGAPAGGPVLELALAVQEVREKVLLVAVLAAHLVDVGAKVRQRVGVRAQLEAIDR